MGVFECIKILIIEDDPVIAKTVKSHIQSWGYETECVTDFNHVMAEFAAFDPSLVLIDISCLFNGYHWCTEIRKVSKVPIIFVSSTSDNMNIVMAVNMGADDFYSQAAFDLNVLMAKVQALLRRTYDFAGQTHLLEHNGVILNLNDATLTYQGEKVDLTKNDYKIMQILLENKGKTYPVTRSWQGSGKQTVLSMIIP